MRLDSKLFRTFFIYNTVIMIILFTVLFASFYNSFLQTEKANLHLVNLLLDNHVNNTIKNIERIFKEIEKSKDFEYLFDENNITRFFARDSLRKKLKEVVKGEPYIFEIRIQKEGNILLSSSPYSPEIDKEKKIVFLEGGPYRILRWETKKKGVKIVFIINIAKVLFEFSKDLPKEYGNIVYLFDHTLLLSFDKKGNINVKKIKVNKEKDVITINNKKYILPKTSKSIYIKACISLDNFYRKIDALSSIIIIIGLLSIITIFLITKTISISITRPIRNLSHIADSFTKGRFQKCTYSKGATKEVKLLIDSFNLMIDRIKMFTEELEERVNERTKEVERQKQELEMLNEELKKNSITDSLTGLYNRRYFDEKFVKDFDLARRNKLFIGFTVIDIDYFKEINDTYGHLCGDVILKKVGNMISKFLKRKTDNIFRYGGDEFVAYTLDSEYRENAFYHLLEGLRVGVKKLNFSCGENNNIKVTLSIGMFFEKIDKNININDIMKRADDMLYKAKKRGRDQVIIADKNNIVTKD